jgi:hypothetical protein
MAQEVFGKLEDVMQNLGSGRNISVLSFKDKEDMQNTLRSIKFPFEILHAYAYNNEHVLILNGLRRLEIKEK